VSTTETTIATAERLTRAMIDNDADAMQDIYTPDAVIWHSTDQVELSLSDLQGILRGIAAVADGDFEVTGRHVTDDGFVQTQIGTYTFRDGSSTTFHAAMVAFLADDGRIRRIDEYVDSAGMNPLLAALEAS